MAARRGGKTTRMPSRSGRGCFHPSDNQAQAHVAKALQLCHLPPWVKVVPLGGSLEALERHFDLLEQRDLLREGERLDTGGGLRVIVVRAEGHVVRAVHGELAFHLAAGRLDVEGDTLHEAREHQLVVLVLVLLVGALLRKELLCLEEGRDEGSVLLQARLESLGLVVNAAAMAADVG
eukprot:CAMPEP_0206042866 /NCGR_PEP_ID=MMETSP1466-20131121/6891_1 /ASSEMBLY_ACC=CAM_ASM_001126 /TAXON_ID=44452 /ORGANISM="Pavlova gyrans, Strain CCMP608" /LENGTH=177 /DNA_ID=CAMNT_0053417593 /DNA_START=450 /DNA_END=984 /DNA_ORIENTATION=-